jgi:HSP20 family protein
MAAKKKSFFERLTGGVKFDDDMDFDEDDLDTPQTEVRLPVKDGGHNETKDAVWTEEEEGQLSIDVYQTHTDIIIQTMVAGVRPEDLQINITRDLVTIRGRREAARTIDDSHYFARELYWGTFSRTISLPQEIEPEEAEAIEKHGLLTIKLPKIDKNRQTTLKVKAM